jgi:undecaprenyl diphosphate synthase
MVLCNHFVQMFVMSTAQRVNARVYHLGRKERLPPELRASLQTAEQTTAHNQARIYNIAIDYSGQDELMRAGRRMADATRTSNELGSTIVDFLDNAGQPYIEPDLVVRTSGEKRMSGFMPYQAAYSELFFVQELFPDLTFSRLEAIAEEFKQRRRTFGG